MLVDLLLLVAGLALLTFGGDSLVRGSTGLARALGVSPLVIGLTVVAFGTSAPELAVCVLAALQGASDIAFGNVVGSNLANIGVIVGLVATLRPIQVTGVVVARELPMMLLATAAAVVMAFDAVLGVGPDTLDRADGLLLLMFFLVFLYYTVGDFARQRASAERAFEAADAPEREPLGRHAAASAIGLAALLGGAELTVDGAIGVATALGVPGVIVGLTIVAVGTSLPELVASLVATARGHSDLAIGNVVGSNIFNLLLIGGATAVVRPIPIPAGGHVDLAVMTVLSLVFFFVSSSNDRRIIRGESALLLAGYLGYVAWRAAYG